MWACGMGVFAPVRAVCAPRCQAGQYAQLCAHPSRAAPLREDKPAGAEALPTPGPTGRAPRELGKPDDVLTLDVARYSVPDGAPASLVQALPGLTAAFVGKGRTYEDISNAASEVTRYLQRELGYYLGYAYIPEQQPVDNVVRIAILEGRLDHVELVWDEACKVDKAVVQAYLDRLKPGAVHDSRSLRGLQDHLRKTIERFEPRLGGVKIGLEPGKDGSRSIRFRVDAVLRLQPGRPPVTFDATLQMGTNACTVQQR